VPVSNQVARQLVVSGTAGIAQRRKSLVDQENMHVNNCTRIGLLPIGL